MPYLCTRKKKQTQAWNWVLKKLGACENTHHFELSD